MAITIVSTHLDDAVFSCWTIIDGEGDVEVVTVFTAGPADRRIVPWDADTGVDSATRMVQRAAENDAALALAGRRATNLGFLENMYDDGSIDLAVLGDHLAQAELVYIPAGVGIEHVNPEHCVARDACLSIRPDARLYADNPYCHFRPDIELPAGIGVGLTRTVVPLTSEQRSRKAEALRCYAGELAKLEELYGPCTDPDRLQYEVFWAPVSV